jgi:hypothetical protein
VVPQPLDGMGGIKMAQEKINYISVLSGAG